MNVGGNGNRKVINIYQEQKGPKDRPLWDPRMHGNGYAKVFFCIGSYFTAASFELYFVSNKMTR